MTPEGVLSKLARGTSSVLLGVTVVVVLLSLGGSMFGWWRVDTVLTGSMEPHIMPGDAVVLRAEPPDAVRVGQIVAFHPPSEPNIVVVHRVIAVTHVHGDIVIRTKGDANNVPDPWHARLGGSTAWHVVATLPKIGYFLYWAHLPITRVVLVVCDGMLGAWIVLRRIWMPSRTGGDDDHDGDEQSSPPPVLEGARNGLSGKPPPGSSSRSPRRVSARRRGNAVVVCVGVMFPLIACSMFSPAEAQWTNATASPTESLATTGLLAPSGVGVVGACVGSTTQSNATVSWNPSGLRDYDNGYLVTGYTVLRSTASAGPYSSVGTTSGSALVEPAATFNDMGLTGFTTPSFYVSRQGAKQVVMVNAATYAKTAITVGKQGTEPNDIAISPNGSKVVVANGSSGTVSVITTATNVVQTVTIPGGSNPNAVAITPDGATAYVTDYNNNLVYPIAISSTTPTLGTAIAVGSIGDPTSMLVTPNGSELYVADYYSGQVTVISTASNVVTATVSINGGAGTPEALAVTPDSAHVYVVDQADNAVFDITTATHAVGTPIAVGNLADGNVATGGDPNIVAMTPNGSTLYVANFTSGTVSAISTSSDTVNTSIVLPAGAQPNALSITPNGCQLYASDYANNQIDVVTVATNVYLTAINVGSIGDPTGMSITPDSTELISSNYFSNNVSVISTGPNSVVKTVALVKPGGIVVTPYELFYEVEATRDAWVSAASVPAPLPLGWDTGDWQ